MPRKATAKTATPPTSFRSRVYTRRLIQHREMVWLYAEIHEIVDRCAVLVGTHTNFLDRFIIDCTLRQAAGILRNRAIFASADDLTNRGLRGDNRYDVVERAMLSSGMEFIYRRTVTQQVGEAPVEPFKDLRGQVPFVPAVYMILIESFLRTVRDYCALSDESAIIRSRIVQNAATSRDLARLSEIERRMSNMERVLGASRFTLYGTIRQVDEQMQTVRYYQEHVIRAFQRLVLQIAKKYGRSEAQIEDNFQQGNVGLQRAFYYFDPRRNKAFSGIARWWIQAQMLLHLKNEANLVKVPNQVWQQHKDYEEMAHSLGIQGDIAALAEATGDSILTIEEVYRTVQMNRPVSIETPASSGDEENPGRVGDSIPDESPTPEEELITASEDPGHYMRHLTPQERMVICCSYGLYQYIPEKTPASPSELALERLCQIAANVYNTEIRGN